VEERQKILREILRVMEGMSLERLRMLLITALQWK
jgi:hypothetical protein